MPYKDPEFRKEYIRKWKEAKRRSTGVPTKREAIQLRTLKQKQALTPEILETRKRKRNLYSYNWKRNRDKTDPRYKMLYAARKRAKDKHISCTITIEDIHIPTVCPFLGIPMVNTRPRGSYRRDVVSLDRIDNTKGYTPDKIEVISWLANSMKTNASKEELICFAKEILKRYDPLS